MFGELVEGLTYIPRPSATWGWTLFYLGLTGRP